MYKIRFFFGPAFRGRAGPLVFLALILVFVPAGWATGSGLGTVIQGTSPERTTAMLATPLAAILSFALLYALGTGVTAHPSEFEFLMTGPIRPREYLLADLAFQLAMVFATGGLAIAVAAVSLVAAVGRPLYATVPLVATLSAYVLMVLLVSQVLVVARVRYPKRPVRTLILVLLAASLVPTVGLVRPDAPAWVQGLPVPSTAFASVAHAILSGTPIPTTMLGMALLYLGAVLAAWAFASDVYIFHGVRPTLSAGFGQVDLAARMDTQRRLIGGLGKVTTRLRLRTDRGGMVGLMTRLHLVRIWRDGSILFVVLFSAVGVVPALAAPAEGFSGATLGVTQILAFLTAVLAINWSYYERENLWIVLTAGGRPTAYFRGLLLSLAVIGLGVTFLYLAALGVALQVRMTLLEVALPIGAPIACAVAAASLLTRVRMRPSAFSPAIFGVLIVVALFGFLGGFAVQASVLAGILLGIAEALQVVVLAAVSLVILGLGLWSVGRLAASFRL
jgi:hypothetical protein